mmetsp:Transcript_42028/g.129884  ORF Transcript_42028/g.129884 Transcript_42028/m.129884 type:complete len:348 (+) Transcript_42028:1978-3021(+)
MTMMRSTTRRRPIAVAALGIATATVAQRCPGVSGPPHRRTFGTSRHRRPPFGTPPSTRCVANATRGETTSRARNAVPDLLRTFKKEAATSRPVALPWTLRPLLSRPSVRRCRVTTSSASTHPATCRARRCSSGGSSANGSGSRASSVTHATPWNGWKPSRRTNCSLPVATTTAPPPPQPRTTTWHRRLCSSIIRLSEAARRSSTQATPFGAPWCRPRPRARRVPAMWVHPMSTDPCPSGTKTLRRNAGRCSARSGRRGRLSVARARLVPQSPPRLSRALAARRCLTAGRTTCWPCTSSPPPPSAAPPSRRRPPAPPPRRRARRASTPVPETATRSGARRNRPAGGRC